MCDGRDPNDIHTPQVLLKILHGLAPCVPLIVTGRPIFPSPTPTPPVPDTHHSPLPPSRGMVRVCRTNLACEGEYKQMGGGSEQMGGLSVEVVQVQVDMGHLRSHSIQCGIPD